MAEQENIESNRPEEIVSAIPEQDIEMTSADESRVGRSSWFSKLAMVIALCSLLIVISLGVWFAERITSQQIEIETYKSELKSYSNSLRVELEGIMPELTEKQANEAAELKRLSDQVKELGSRSEFLGADANDVETSVAIWRIRNLVKVIHQRPLDATEKKSSLLLLSRFRSSLNINGPDSIIAEISNALNSDWMSLKEVTPLKIDDIYTGLNDLLQVSAGLGVLQTVTTTPYPEPQDDNDPLEAKGVDFIANVWSEIKSLVKVRRIDVPRSQSSNYYFFGEGLKLKILEAINLTDGKHAALLVIQLDEIKAYLEKHYDVTNYDVRAALNLTNKLKLSATVSTPNFTSTLDSIDEYFNSLAIDESR